MLIKHLRMMEGFRKLAIKLAKDISLWELDKYTDDNYPSYVLYDAPRPRKNKRTQKAMSHFVVAIYWFIMEIYKKFSDTPNHELMVQLRAGYYSSNKIMFKDNHLTYRQMRAAYEGLIALGYIVEETKGGYSKETGKGQSTRFSPTPEFLEIMGYSFE